MNLVEWVLVPAIKRPAGASNEVGYAQTDDDRHQRGDELETAHEILRVLHDGPSLFGIGLGNRATNGNSRMRVLGSAGCQPAGLGSLPRPGQVRGIWKNYICKDVAGRAAGNYMLAACAPQKYARRVRYPVITTREAKSFAPIASRSRD